MEYQHWGLSQKGSGLSVNHCGVPGVYHRGTRRIDSRRTLRIIYRKQKLVVSENFRYSGNDLHASLKGAIFIHSICDRSPDYQGSNAISGDNTPKTAEITQFRLLLQVSIVIKACGAA